MMKTGIKKLDKIIGTIDEGSILIIESPGELSIYLAKKFVKEENTVVFIHRKQTKFFPEIKSKIPGENYSLQELYTIPLAIKDTHEKVVIFTLFPQIYMLHDSNKAYQILVDVAEIIRESKRMFVATIDTSIMDERTIAMLESEADYVIEIREVIKDLKILRGIRVKKSLSKKPSGFYEFDIRDLSLGDPIE